MKPVADPGQLRRVEASASRIGGDPQSPGDGIQAPTVLPAEPIAEEPICHGDVEADSGELVTPAAEPAEMLAPDELDRLTSGFEQIRDQEPLDDVGDWANAVVQLLEDEARR